MPEQLELALGPSCKKRGCGHPVVGSSITGKGHVCKTHNTEEWGAALTRSKDPWYRKLGSALSADAAKLERSAA